MRKNKLTHLLEPSLRLYFVFLLLFAAVSALFSVAVAVIEAAVVAVLYLYFRRRLPRIPWSTPRCPW